MKLNFSILPKTASQWRVLAFSGTAFGLALGLVGPTMAHPPKAQDGAAKASQQESGMEGMKGMHMEKMGGHEHGDEEFSFGHPSPDAKPDQIIQINALDSMRYDPPKITVGAGSVVKFVVTNKGKIAHSWAIDTVKEQREHEESMQNVDMDNMMGHMDSEPNGFVLKPGETKTLVWTFTKGGNIQYACHLPGHYGAGMHGEVMVKGVENAASDNHNEAKAHAHEEN